MPNEHHCAWSDELLDTFERKQRMDFLDQNTTGPPCKVRIAAPLMPLNGWPPDAALERCPAINVKVFILFVRSYIAKLKRLCETLPLRVEGLAIIPYPTPTG